MPHDTGTRTQGKRQSGVGNSRLLAAGTRQGRLPAGCGDSQAATHQNHGICCNKDVRSCTHERHRLSFAKVMRRVYPHLASCDELGLAQRSAHVAFDLLEMRDLAEVLL
jgi:hypothetical protein